MTCTVELQLIVKSENYVQHQFEHRLMLAGVLVSILFLSIASINHGISSYMEVFYRCIVNKHGNWYYISP